MIHYVSPYSIDKNFGKAINDFCALVPDGDWICVRDGDSMFLTPEWGKQIAEVCENTDFDLIGCYTNRLGRRFQLLLDVDYHNHDIKYHYEIALRQQENYWGQMQNITSKRHIAGLFMLFRKSLWNKIKFEENTARFDDRFSNAVVKSGGKLGLIKGLYCYHWYRGWSSDPARDSQHLI